MDARVKSALKREAAAGAALPHDSAHLHVTGRASYTDDLPEPRDLLHIAVGMSTAAHANIRALDLSKVAAAPGVVDVCVASDIPGINNYGPIVADDPIFATTVVEYAGQPVFAAIATSVDAARNVTVHNVTVAADIGPVLNMSGAEAQAQGAVLDGLSTMQGLEITIENGRVQQVNFDNYPIMRIAGAPEVDVHFIQSDFDPTGFGEPALPPLAPAVCNAIFSASGIRIRSLPLTKSNFTLVASLDGRSI